MKIAFVVDDFKGGAFNVCRLVGGYLSNSCEVSLIILKKSVETRYSMAGINYFVQTKKARCVSQFISNVRFIRNVLNTVKPDVVISFLFGVSACTYLALIGKRSIVFICSERSNPAVLKPNFPLSLLVNKAYRKANHLVLLFNNFIDIYPKSFRSKCRVIPNPVLKPSRASSFNGGVKRIVTCGNSIMYKGYDLLIDAAALALETNKDFSLEIYGQFDKTPLARKIADYGIENYVFLKEYSPKIFDILDGAYAYIMTSRVEGFPNALIEAMSVGLLPIAFPCHNGIRHIVDETCGIIIESNTPIGIAKSITDSLNIKAEKYDVLCYNATKVVDRYNLDNIGNQWAELINSCLVRREK